MSKSIKTMKHTPILPAPLSLPLKILPAFVHNKALVNTLNRVFHNEIKQGELEFLQDKIIQISIEDAGIEYRFSYHHDKLLVVDESLSPNLVLRGTIYNYLLLASRQEDTDTLFFSRRLQMQGDTELGLYVKNFLDGMDMDSHQIPRYIESLLQKSLPLYERLFGK